MYKAISDHGARITLFGLSWLPVMPLPPWDLKIQFVNASVSRCSLQWRDEDQVLHNRLRYRPSNSRSWNMVIVFRVKGGNKEGFYYYCTDLCLHTIQMWSLRIFNPKVYTRDTLDSDTHLCLFKIYLEFWSLILKFFVTNFHKPVLILYNFEWPPTPLLHFSNFSAY